MNTLTRRQAIAASLGIMAWTFLASDSFQCSDEDGILYDLWYPPGATKIRGVTEPVENSELARECVELIRAGAVVTLPRIVDEHGNRMWQLKVFLVRDARRQQVEAIIDS